MNSQNENYQETLSQVRDTLSVQEVQPMKVEEILASQEYRAFQHSEPQKSLEDFLNRMSYEGDPRLFSQERFTLRNYSASYTDRDIEDFAERILNGYELIKMTNPDAILYPLRGSEVFKLSMERIARIRGEEESLPQSILVPIGTHGNPYTRSQILLGQENWDSKLALMRSLKNFSSREKQAIVQATMEKYADENDFEKILLIDEVLHGNSIIQTVDFLDRYNSRASQAIEIKVGAFEFSKSRRGKRIERYESGMLIPIQKNRKYIEKAYLSSNNPFNFIMLTPPMVVDKPHYLPLVIREQDSTYEMKIYTSEQRIPHILEAVEERAKQTPPSQPDNFLRRAEPAYFNL